MNSMELSAQIPLQSVSLLPALISDYLQQKDALARLYKYAPAVASFKQAIADKEKVNTDRPLLVQVLKQQYGALPPSSYVNSNIDLLLADTTFTIATAHQPSLFMGPLYTIYKIASVIHLTRTLKQHYPAYNFVPVYWLGSEDHDIEELNHIFLNGQKIEWQQQVSGAIGRVNSKVVAEAFEQLKAAGTDSSLLHILEAGLGKYETFGDYSQYLVHEIFKDYGLVVLNQDNQQLKYKLAGIIEDEVLNRRGEQLLRGQLGFLETHYKVQATPREINFFYLGEGFRERIVWDAATQQYVINNRNKTFTADEIRHEIKMHPERFSPNVILRPLYQEIILPNLAFVGGAGELSYWLELKPLFGYYKVNYPVLALRGSAVVLSASTHNKLQKLNLQPQDFFGDIEQLIKEFVKAHAGSSTSLAVQKQALAAVFEEVLQHAKNIDATLENNVAAERQKALQMLENIEGKMLKAEKRRQETALNQLRAVHAAIMPNGTLQERVENFIPYYSAGIVQQAVDCLDPLAGNLSVFINR